MSKVEVTLEYQERQYVVNDGWDWEPSEWHDDPRGQAIYMWEEGNYSCDCNRSIFIQRHCDTSFPTLGCGDTIKLISIELLNQKESNMPEEHPQIVKELKEVSISIGEYLGEHGFGPPKDKKIATALTLAGEAITEWHESDKNAAVVEERLKHCSCIFFNGVLKESCKYHSDSENAAVREFAEKVKTHWAYDPDNSYDSEYQIGRSVIYYDTGGRTYTLGEVIDQLLASLPGEKP